MLKVGLMPGEGRRLARDTFVDAIGKPITITVGGRTWLSLLYTADVVDDGAEVWLALDVEDQPS
jgi:hypothetical protein